MLISLLSVKGSPGVTTFAVALTARWPAPARPLLVEADPSGGDLALRFGLSTTPNLVSLAAAARRGGDPEVIWLHTQQLPDGLAVITAPPDANQACAALSALASDNDGGVGILRAAAYQPGVVVIADCGRVDPDSPALPIVCASDALVLLTRAHADDLAHLPRRMPAIGAWSAYPVLLLVGDGYAAADVTRELGVPPLGRVPDDPYGAAVLAGRPITPRRRRYDPTHSALGKYAHTIATALALRQPPTQPLSDPPVGGPTAPHASVPRLPSASQPIAVMPSGSHVMSRPGSRPNDRGEGGQAS
ncbi:chromosome partitioning protein [Umezawaea tangerina]|uniref:MinD-like ATPase involved in chromosome partitioning or flagellar assembly n=1 Tax=Umezawaea tangerina TaxID=84725 RepID=A0A2T0S7B8_9PSEU|nr:chromosome partitioning protein [Umezawaea tangerina]PRY29203.1 hypothetical protein CLV43_12680 [Umezawaea tangerina]